MKTQLKKGVLEMCVLSLISKRDHYAYEIVQTLEETIEISEGTIYPLMRRLQTEKFVSTYLVESLSGPSRKYYKIEEKGKLELEVMKNEWRSFYVDVNYLLDIKEEKK